jgi:tetratricopeptide (TPR) repeat protein
VGPTDLNEALRLKRAGDYDGAVIALEAVLSRQPRHPLALAQLADVQLRRGRLQEAAATLDRAEAAGGATAFTCRLRGDVQYRSGHFAEAATSYRDASALGDSDSWPLVQLARCRLRLGDLEGARGAASAAAERDPGKAAPWVVLGDAAVKGGQPEEAEAHYRRAHEREPDDEWAYAKLVEVRLAQLPEDRREQEIRVLMKTSRQNRHLAGVLANLRKARGDSEGAAEVWASRARDGDRYARKQEGFALGKAGRLDEAAAVLGACLAEDPEDRFVFSSYVSVQRRRGATEELRRVLEGALPRAGSRRGAYYGELRKLAAADPDAAASDDPAGGQER